MSNCREAIPQLKELAILTQELTPEVKVNDVVELFNKDSSIKALPVLRQGMFTGFVSRKHLFFKRLRHKYALDLYGNKPVGMLLDENPLVMEPDKDVHSALERLLSLDPNLETDCFPIVADGRCLGIVSVADLMMRISKTQASLLDRVITLSARIRDEVALASKIQQDLLPAPEFNFRGTNISAGVMTSSEIGGDFFDYFTLGDNKLGLIIADVSGHGVQSGMVTTAAKASLHTLISMGISRPSELLFGMNTAIMATACQTLLMTCLIVLMDIEKEEISFANAGHNFPYLYRSDSHSLEQLQEVSGFPLGFESGSSFREFITDFKERDRLILYTDGLIECRNPSGVEFGYSRLESLFIHRINLSPKEMKNLLFESALDFIGSSSSIEDDISIMVVANNG
jgi:serine phosphatase RsbU (regulator of sigma subunit)/CBS domain-containing protein